MSTSIRCVDQRMYCFTTIMVEKMYEDILPFLPQALKNEKKLPEGS